MRQAQLEACLCSPALSVMGFTGEDTSVFDVQFACKPCIQKRAPSSGNSFEISRSRLNQTMLRAPMASIVWVMVIARQEPQLRPQP